MVIKNKVAVITGAGKGIGFAVASELASLGFSLGIVARNENDIAAASAEILQQYPDVKIIYDAFDVADENHAANFVSRVRSELGDVSVLVNNAGFYKPGTAFASMDDVVKSVDVNYLAAVRFVQAVLPTMRNHNSGYIFNIASLCGVEAFPDTGIYSASKFALVGYSSALAQELAPEGIKVTALCPSWVNTQGAGDAPMNPEDMIQTNDIALTIRYLLSLGSAVSIREIIIRC